MAVELLDSRVVTLSPEIIEAELLDSRVVTLSPEIIEVELLDSRVVALSPLVEPCQPGETKCVGSDLYECSLAREWVLVEENSPKCPIEEEKKFPWAPVAIGVGAVVAVVGLAAAERRRK